MTQNLDSVYFIMNKKNRDSIYVSPSIETVLGIPRDTPKPLLAVQKIETDSENDFSVSDIIDLPEGESIVRDCWLIPIGSSVPKMFQKTVYHVKRGMEDLLIFELTDHTHEQEVRKNIQDALEIAKSANAAKSSFLSNMSHDIRPQTVERNQKFEIPIIAMTANAFSDDIQRSMESGMNAHISKPMDLQILEKVVRNIMRN